MATSTTQTQAEEIVPVLDTYTEEALAQMTLADKLNITTESLGDYTVAKKNDEAHHGVERAKFFELLSEHIEANEVLESKSVYIEAESKDAANEEALAKNPGWLIENTTPAKTKGKVVPGAFNVLMAEDPALVKFTWVNRDTGMVYGRVAKADGAGYDVAKLVEDHPELAAQCVNKTVVVTAALDSKDFAKSVDKLVAEGKASVSYSLDTKLLTKLLKSNPAALVVFQNYHNPGTIKLSLAPLRVAKPEELED